MAREKQKIRKPSTKAQRPSWFPSFDQPSPWWEPILISPENAQPWVQGIIGLWTNPTTRQILVDRYWTPLLNFQNLQKERMNGMDWSSLSGHELVRWALDSQSLTRTLETFLPPPYESLPPAIKRWLFIHIFLSNASTYLAGHPDDPLGLVDQPLPPLAERELLPACRMISLHMGAPFIQAEFLRRAKKHVGFPASVLVLVLELTERLGRDPVIPDPTLDALTIFSLDQLRKATWRQTKGRLEKIGPKENITETLDQNLAGQIAITVRERWGSLEGLDALARALDGELNIAPRAIQDDIGENVKRLFPSMTQRQEIPASEPHQEMGTEQVTIKIEEVPDPEDRIEKRLHEMDAEQFIKRFAHQHPEHTQGIDFALAKGTPLSELAKKAGITVQTVINRRTRAVKALKTWGQSLDCP